MTQTITITAPAFLASALINNDISGLSEAEMAELETVKEYLGYNDGWRVVSTTDDEPRFTWSFRIYGGNASGGDVVDYVLIRTRR